MPPKKARKSKGKTEPEAPIPEVSVQEVEAELHQSLDNENLDNIPEAEVPEDVEEPAHAAEVVAASNGSVMSVFGIIGSNLFIYFVVCQKMSRKR